MPITLDGTNGITTPTYGGADTSEYLVPVTQFKNRIINGAMQIDQRNAGASVTITNDTGVFTLDRWRFFENTGGVITAQQSSIAPAGFTNSLLVTVTTADTSITSGELAIVEQKIEGFNVADLGWGTANAQTVTLSFWVRSNLTGTFGGALRNSADNRSYAFSYTINSANTFEQKTITIAGDTTGTWVTNNGIGLNVTFGLAVGSNFLGTAGSWSGSNLQSATGQTNLLATVSNTFYITGVQLEKGSTATSFDYRPYGTELQLCQRYFEELAPPTGTANAYINNGTVWASSQVESTIRFSVLKRANPTMTGVNNISWSNMGGTLIQEAAAQFDKPTTVSVLVYTNGLSGWTQGQCARLTTNSAGTTRIQASAEL